jgi:hypothetical protein
MFNKLAQVEYPDSSGFIRGIGEYGIESGSPGTAPTRFNSFLSNIIGLLTIIAGIWFFFVLIIGAIQWIGAGGDKTKVVEAKQKITMGLIGITIVVAALFIADIVGGLLGFPQILDPGGFIDTLGP